MEISVIKKNQQTSHTATASFTFGLPPGCCFGPLRGRNNISLTKVIFSPMKPKDNWIDFQAKTILESIYLIRILSVTSSLLSSLCCGFVVTEKIVGFHTWKINKEILLPLLNVPFVQAFGTMLVSKQTLAWRSSLRSFLVLHSFLH